MLEYVTAGLIDIVNILMVGMVSRLSDTRDHSIIVSHFLLRD